MSATPNIQPSRIRAGKLALTGTTSNGSTNILELFTSGGTLVGSVNTSGTILTSGGTIGKIITAINTYQILVTDSVIVCNNSTGFTITLPITAVGQIFIIKNIGAGDITLIGYGGSDTVDGELSQTISQWNSITVQCPSVNTWVIN